MSNDISSPFVWESDFPPVYGHTSISFLKQCPGFKDAKNGDMRAAINVVSCCIKQERISELKKNYPKAILLPIITNNKLPEALAGKIGMNTHKVAYSCAKQSRKTLTAMERLMNKPCFYGKVVKGSQYIIVDDIVTQGGTVSALRKHVINCGGTVVAVAALAFSTDSRVIAPTMPDVRELTDKFTSGLLIDFLKEHHIADDIGELTRQEVKYLLCFKHFSNINEKLTRVHSINISSV